MEPQRYRRPRHKMPKFIKDALYRNRLLEDYNARPSYQRNDYIGWILGAKREEARQKRLTQMLEELRIGGVYMKMDHPPSRKVRNIKKGID